MSWGHDKEVALGLLWERPNTGFQGIAFEVNCKDKGGEVETQSEKANGKSYCEEIYFVAFEKIASVNSLVNANHIIFRLLCYHPQY